MSLEQPIDRVYVVPVNGYANRLQAWASSAILAAHLDSPLRVMWEPELAAAASASDLFDASLVSRAFASPSELTERVGGTHQDMPRYLTHLPDRDLIILAGHDRGEQAFMDELLALVPSLSRPTTLVIIAGGKFHLPGTGDFTMQRRIFYSGLRWSAQVEEPYSRLSASHPDFTGLHVRHTDRSLEAPRPRLIKEALGRLREAARSDSLFIAADTAEARELWSTYATQIGFAPWRLKGVDLDRASTGAGVDALVDWRLLARCSAVVYPAASTFSGEAVVAGGSSGSSIPLIAGPTLQKWRSARGTAINAAGYPRRRLTAR